MNRRYFVSTDRELLDRNWVHQALEAEHWGWEYTYDIVSRNIDNGLCFGLYARDEVQDTVNGEPVGEPKSTIVQLGFARVITDRVSLSMVCDVVIDLHSRGQGLGKQLMAAVVGHPDVKHTISILGTKDAWGFYEQFGYRGVAQPMMQRPPLKP